MSGLSVVSTSAKDALKEKASHGHFSKVSVADIVGVKHDLHSSIHNKPKEEGHRKTDGNLPLPIVIRKRKSSQESHHSRQNQHHASKDSQRRRSSNEDGTSSLSSSAGDRESIPSAESVAEKGDEDDGWNLFIEEGLGDVDDLVETGPLFEMANVDIDVEEALGEMEETLQRSLANARVSDRERTVLLDKFGLFLQALVSFQENEVELIDSIGMKVQIMEVLKTFASEEIRASEVKLTDETKDEEVDEASILDSPALALDEVGGKDDEIDATRRKDIGGITVDEMSATVVRENLLIQKNKLEMQEQMKVIHVLEIKQLEFEKTLLTMHYGKMIKPTELQKEMRDLRKAITEMKIEIGTMQQEITQLQLDIAAEEKVLHEIETTVNQLDLEVLTKQIEVTQNSAKPLHLSKEADRDAHKLELLQDTLQDLEERWMAGMTTYRIFQAKIDQKNSEYETLLKEEARMSQAKKVTLQETDYILAELETLQKKEHSLLNKCRLAIERIAYNVKLKKKLSDEHHVTYNETTRAQREYQKLERTIKLASDAHLNARLVYEKMRSAFDAIQPKGSADNWEKLYRMFIHEIANLKNALDLKLNEASIQASVVSKLQDELNALYEDQLQCGKELQDYMRKTVRKRRERQDKAEQCVKLENQLFAIITDIRIKMVVLEDCGRNERDIQRVMVIMRKRYAQVKVEKAAVVNDLLHARQRVMEQAEKFKIANSEIDSYINQSLDRQREITRIHYLLLNAGLARDSVRNDALRAVLKFRYHRIERDEIKMGNSNTRNEISRLRVDVRDIRNRFEAAIQMSADVAISVRERTEEVCTFIERIQAYDMILLKGSAELRLREIEKSKLFSTLNEAKTHLFIVTSNEPDEGKYVKIIEGLRVQLQTMTKERRFLENELSNITGPGRVREINHNWIDEREQAPILQKKINKLECLLATREVRILERELAIGQIEELTESSMEKASWLKQKYECEVKHLVRLRKYLYHLSERIDGLICEASLAITRAESAETAYMEQKKTLSKATCRFERGLPPTGEMEYQWNRKVWQEEMLRRSNSRGQGFLVEKSRQNTIGMALKRFRPKRKVSTESYNVAPLPIDLTAEKPCPRFPYFPTRSKISCVKPVISRLRTGLRVCR